MSEINAGIVGMGKMGLLHAGILNSLDVNISAIAEKEEMIGDYIKNALPKVSVYDDYRKMINKEDLDLVYITTPVSSHIDIANLCVENNVNFFVEKPFARNMKESAELCNKLKRSNIIHAVGYSKRFLDTFSKAKELLDSSILGDLIYIRSSMYVSQIFTTGKGWRYKKSESGGGVLLEFSSHLIDMLLWYFGKIDSVSTIMRSYYSTEVEDFAHSTLEFVNGLKGYLDTSWSIRNYRLPEITIEVHGSNGMMLVNDDYIRLLLDNESNGYQKGLTTIYKQALNEGVIIDLGGPEYTREDLHVVNCIREKRQTMINCLEASKSQSVIDAMYESANTHTFKKIEYVI